VQGSGRVPKYRHHAYEWLGVDKTELAVMTELLLRGEADAGRVASPRRPDGADRRPGGPAAGGRFAPGQEADDRADAAGRGQIVSHNLYKDRELVELQAQMAGYTPPADDSESDRPPASAPPQRVAVSSPPAAAPVASQKFVTPDELSAGGRRRNRAASRSRPLKTR